MKHIIDGVGVNIDWDKLELIERHDSGESDWIVNGYGDDGKEYFGDGNYQHDELINVTEIELAE